MNKANVQKAIDVMTRVRDRGDELYMGLWQHCKYGCPVRTEDELHTCGTSACFAGWVAVSPEWKRDGGKMDPTGCPVYGDHGGPVAIKEWFGAADGVGVVSLCGLGYKGDLIRVYPNAEYTDDITVDHVIAALTRLRDTGTVYLTGGN